MHKAAIGQSKNRRLAMIPVRNNGLLYYRFETLAEQRGIDHAIFTRLGGRSAPPFATLNVGATVGDDPETVHENRRIVFAEMGVSPAEVVTCYQVHSAAVAPVGVRHGGQVVPATDGLMSTEPVALFLRFADCVPIILYDPVRRAAALIHAGWRGTAAGIAAVGVARMAQQYGSRPGDILACIGPSIGPCCYRVGDDFLQAASAQWPEAKAYIARRNGALYADLWEMNRRQLLDAGVAQVEVARICTACRNDEFFSHRADGGRTGRFAAIVRLR